MDTRWKKCPVTMKKIRPSINSVSEIFCTESSTVSNRLLYVLLPLPMLSRISFKLGNSSTEQLVTVAKMLINFLALESLNCVKTDVF